jgi:hypothetical protein
MIAALGPSPGTSAARQYAGTMAGFWSRLSGTLRGLESLAADSRRLDAEALDALRTLQYQLHWSSELLAGVEPPAGVRAGHEELADALVDARDATGEVVEAMESGGRDAAAELVYEWRGSLFRVRLARMRLTTSPVPPAEPSEPTGSRSAAAATVLTLLGATAFAAGAVLLFWPIWAAGLALVAGGLLAYRP